MTIKLGTRGSQLALWQAHFVAKLLQEKGVNTEVITFETKGDKILHTTLAKIGSKGVFTEELEEALRQKTIDVAVHSAKDLQSELAEDLEIIAFTEREKVHDVVLSFNPTLDIEHTQNNFIIGTSSTRRVALLKHFYPHVQTKNIRGNLQTRLAKLEKGGYDAIILAYAGVQRMKYNKLIIKDLDINIFTPPVGQGCIALEASLHLDKDRKSAIRQAVNHVPSETCLRAERSFLKTLQGGCSIPVFGLAHLDGDTLSLQGGIISLDGKNLIRKQQSLTKQKAEELGKKVAQDLLGAGGNKILEEIREHS